MRIVSRAGSCPSHGARRAGCGHASPAPGDIIVTAQRRSQSIQTVPIAITALSGSQLSDKGVTNANQLGQIVPNLQINSAMGDTQPNFALRGVSVANEYNPNQVSPIGVYIDDVNMVNRVGQGGGLYDLQRVEVLRGPQGTLFGRNTTGGAINFITNTPTLRAIVAMPRRATAISTRSRRKARSKPPWWKTNSASAWPRPMKRATASSATSIPASQMRDRSTASRCVARCTFAPVPARSTS
jgi:outer membrane receptor protein involved in Fe transport